MKKLLLSSLIITSMAVFAYTQTDVDNATYLAGKGIITSQSTTAGYRLDDTITRAEVAGIALKVKGISLPNNYYCKNYFTDVKYDSTNNWICRAIELAADNGIITRTNTKARPQDKITRAEALAIIMKASGEEIGMGGEAGYKYYFDANLYGEGGVGYRNAYAFGANWQAETFYQYIRNIVKNDTLLKQNPLPNNNATRAEVFGFVRNLLTYNESKKNPTTGNYKTYINNHYKFSLNYPEDSTISGNEEDTYIRIQNYPNNRETIGLGEKEFYLEMHLGGTRNCNDEIQSPEEFYVNGIKGLRGFGQPGGDSGGVRYALCVNNKNQGYYIQVTEISQGGTIAEKILNSFNFIN